MKDIGKLFKELKDKYKEFHTDSSISSDNAAEIFRVLKSMVESEEGTMLRSTFF